MIDGRELVLTVETVQDSPIQDVAGNAFPEVFLEGRVQILDVQTDEMLVSLSGEG